MFCVPSFSSLFLEEILPFLIIENKNVRRKNVKIWHAAESGNFSNTALNFKEFWAQVVQESDFHIQMCSFSGYLYSFISP